MYAAVVNTPGYLPEGEPVYFKTAAEAWAYLADERARDDLAYVPDDPDDPDGPASLDETTLELERLSLQGESCGTVYGPTPGCIGDCGHDLGLAYSVEWVNDSAWEGS